jgi:inosose dehydratase
MQSRIANGPASWGVLDADSPLNPTWHAFLDGVTVAGYNCIELGPLGYFPDDTRTVLDELDRRNVSVAGTFLYEDLHNEAAAPQAINAMHLTCRRLQELGAEFLVVIDAMCPERLQTSGRSAEAERLTEADWRRFVRLVSEIARDCRERYGLQAVFHPHVASYVEFADEIARLMDDTNESLVQLCVDTGHSAFAGVDPCELVAQYGRRVSYLHLKDVDPEALDTVRERKLDFYSALEVNVFSELGRGVVDFQRLRRELERHNFTGPATVEQDVDPEMPGDPSEAAARNLRYLRSIDFAD